MFAQVKTEEQIKVCRSSENTGASLDENIIVIKERVGLPQGSLWEMQVMLPTTVRHGRRKGGAASVNRGRGGAEKIKENRRNFERSREHRGNIIVHGRKAIN